jgi:hypothetical protein
MNTIMPSDNFLTRFWKKANALARNVKRLVGASPQGSLAAENAEQKHRGIRTPVRHWQLWRMAL